jgi:regulator of cell morphogenesis and NO signaling
MARLPERRPKKEAAMPKAVETVGEIAVRHPHSIRVFERFGIDYCCGGEKPLGVACAEKDLEISAVLDALAAETLAGAVEETDWSRQKLSALCEHIVSRHHAFLRDQLPRLAQLAEKVAGKHAGHHPELRDIRAAFDELNTEITQHLAKEEQVLFPYLDQLEASAAVGGAKPQSCFGSVASPISVMMAEHDGAGRMLEELRRLSNGYNAPADGCASFRAFYDCLHDLEQDLHQHIHLENNILFPRAIELEQVPSESQRS